MRRNRHFAHANALTTWSTLGLRWAEMMAASGAVVAHRTARQNTPGQVLDMATEKGAAAVESSQAMARHWMRMATLGGAAFPAAWAKMLASGMAPYHARATRNARGLRRK